MPRLAKATLLCLQLLMMFTSACASDTADFSVRLANGSTQNEGRVEVYYQGVWGVICDLGGEDDWNSAAGSVVCRQLGYQSLSQIKNNFHTASRPVILTRLSCSASETSLAACQHDSMDDAASCSTTSDEIAGLVCSGSPGPVPTPSNPLDFSVRLQDGASDSEGRVEIAYKGVWGSICHESWTKTAADVVCRQLGYPSAIYAWKNGYFGESSANPSLDNVVCTGAEPNLAACGHWRWGTISTACSVHSSRRDAGVTCNDTATQPTSPSSVTPLQDFSVRLVDGSAPNEGRVEVYYQGVWGTICNKDSIQWNKDAGDVICRQLGYSDAFNANGNFGRGSGPVIVNHLQCGASESSLAACRHNSMDQSADCSDSFDRIAGVSCDGRPGPAPTPSTPEDFSVRLQDGASDSEGRVEISYKGVWGSICHESWTKADADVVCRQLGFPSAIYPWKYGYFGQNSAYPSLDGVDCTGEEPNLAACGHSRWGTRSTDCSSSHTRRDAGVTCNDTALQPTTPPSVLPVQDFSVRLVYGSAPNEGRVEVFYQGVWGTICDSAASHWNVYSADIVCRQLGYSRAFGLPDDFITGTSPVIVTNLLCGASDSSLAACRHDSLDKSAVCSGLSATTAGVSCDGEPGPAPTPSTPLDFSVRLANGGSENQGRVEIAYQGQWGTVCDDGWDKADADVVCRQLHYQSAISAVKNGHFGPGSGIIALTQVDCNGTEPDLAACGHNRWGASSGCQHSTDAGVICNTAAEMTTPEMKASTQLLSSPPESPTTEEMFTTAPRDTTPSSTTVQHTKSTTEKQGLSGGAIAGIVIAVLIVAGMVTFLSVFLVRRSRRAGNDGMTIPLESAPGGTTTDITV